MNLSTSSSYDPSSEGIQPCISSSISEGPREKSSTRPYALVVDDVVDVSEMIAMLLRHAGYDVVTAPSAATALEAATQQQFDIVVSDIGMPEMNGYQLAVAIRKLPDYRTIPMIAVTGFSKYDDRGRALESGFNAHVTKPINPSALLELMENLRGQGGC